MIGPFELDSVAWGDCRELALSLPDDCVDLLITSPPYWGQRLSEGIGVEDDPRKYLGELVQIFTVFLPKLKPKGIMWVNLGDAYNTPVNWRETDHRYSSLGPERAGLSENNSAYVKPRAKRRAFVDQAQPWLRYGSLLGLPSRLAVALSDEGYLFRGEVIWRKKNPMPEGRCRRPHRHHETILLLAKSEDHDFRIAPPVPTVWEFPSEKIDGLAHYSRFPEELPRRCIEAYGKLGGDVLVVDPFSGSGTTGIAALKLGCSYLGFEIDRFQAEASNMRLATVKTGFQPLFRDLENAAIV